MGDGRSGLLPRLITPLKRSTLCSSQFDRFHQFSFRKEALSMLNLNSVMIGTTQPEVLAAFYEKVLGKPADMVDSENGFFGWQVGSASLSVLEHSEMAGNTKDPGRLILNFETPQVKEEFERIRAIGGSVIREPYEMGGGWIATLADPEGNYFQLITPMG
jgi:predicted enzyme related to lactoylglutathione lyase